jgi:hypothetical protein
MSLYVTSTARSEIRNGTTGIIHDITAAWQGELAYDPGRVRAPVAIIRGEWDSVMRHDLSPRPTPLFSD